MVVERWALRRSAGKYVKMSGPAVGYVDDPKYLRPTLDRVRVLEDDDEELLRMIGEHLRAAQSCHQCDKRLRAILPTPPEPPTYEELLDAVRRVVRARDLSESAKYEVGRDLDDLLARAEAAKRNES
ncbi:MAG: hypothetical protein ACF8XB_09070 [Planctomycetota bacterium JB042]